SPSGKSGCSRAASGPYLQPSITVSYAQLKQPIPDILWVQDLGWTIKRFDNIECSRLEHGKVLAHACPNGPAVLLAYQLGQLEIAPVSVKPSRLHLCDPLAANVLVQQYTLAQLDFSSPSRDSLGPESH